MTDKIIISRKEIERIVKQLQTMNVSIAQSTDDLRALLDKAEVSEPDISYYGILDTGTVIDVNDTYDESNNRLKSLIEHDKDYEMATIITLYTSPQPNRVAELEAEIAKLTAIIEDMKVVDNVFSK